jgi:hypothetical protein
VSKDNCNAHPNCTPAATLATWMSALIGTLFFPLLFLLLFRDDDAAATALFSSLITPQPTTTTTTTTNNNNKINRNWINSSSKHTEILPSSLATAILPQIAIHDLNLELISL